jgi:hypothetical protein
MLVRLAFQKRIFAKIAANHGIAEHPAFGVSSA